MQINFRLQLHKKVSLDKEFVTEVPPVLSVSVPVCVSLCVFISVSPAREYLQLSICISVSDSASFVVEK